MVDLLGQLSMMIWVKPVVKLIGILHAQKSAVKRLQKKPLILPGTVALSGTEIGRRNRDHAHDEEGAVALPCQSTHVRYSPVLKPPFLIFHD